MRPRFLLIIAVAVLVASVACSGGSQGTAAFTSSKASAAPNASAVQRPSGAATETTQTQAAAPTSISLSRPARASRSGTASVVQVTVGDDPADRVLSLSITVNALSLASSAGAVPLLPAPATVEISSLAGTTTPLSTVTVPAGTYNKAIISLGATAMSIMDPDTGATIQKTFSAPPHPFALTLDPAFVSDGTPLVINLSLDLHSSVAIDPTTGALTFNPIFIETHGRIAGPPPGIGPNPFTGGVDHVLGTVTAVSGTTFTVTTAVGQRSLTFNTSNSTIWKNVSGLSGLQTGMLVAVGGQAQSDGSLLALGVVVVNGLRNAIGVVGIVTKTAGTPVTQFQVLAHGVSPLAMMPDMTFATPGFLATVNVTNTTVFRAGTDNVDMTGLNLTFDDSNLSPAQRVEVDTTVTPIAVSPTVSGIAGIIFSATQVELELQPVAGMIGDLTSSSFTLTVPKDSVFATLTKTRTITVYVQPGTAVNDGVTLANGQKVVVRGLLFNNSGYQMVAKRIGVLQ